MLRWTTLRVKVNRKTDLETRYKVGSGKRVKTKIMSISYNFGLKGFTSFTSPLIFNVNDSCPYRFKSHAQKQFCHANPPQLGRNNFLSKMQDFIRLSLTNPYHVLKNLRNQVVTIIQSSSALYFGDTACSLWISFQFAVTNTLASKFSTASNMSTFAHFCSWWRHQSQYSKFPHAKHAVYPSLFKNLSSSGMTEHDAVLLLTRHLKIILGHTQIS